MNREPKRLDPIGCYGFGAHADGRALRGALIELYESWKDLNRICSETTFVDAHPGLYDETKKAANAARRRVEKILKKTAIKT